MTVLLSRFFSFLLFIGIFMPIEQTHAVWEQPPHQFLGSGSSIGMGSDANGNAVVVLDNSGTVEAFYYSRLTDTWTGPTILGSDNGQVFMDMHPSGTALAVWVDPTNRSLHSAYFNGTSWTTGLPDPFALPGGNVLGVIVSMNSPNTALATWMDDNTFNYNSNIFTIGSWGPVLEIFPNSDPPFSADYSSNGTAVASYPNPAGTELLVSNFIGGSWQALPGTLLDPSMPLTPLSDALARIDSNGHAAVVWVNSAGNVMTSSYFGDPLIGWTSAIQLSTTPNNVPTSVSFSMAPDGTGVATWVDGTGVGFSSSYNGTTWSSPQQFGTLLSSRETSVSVNASGDALLLFETLSGTIFSSRLPLNGVWTAPELVTTPTGAVPFLIASLSDDGFGFAAFAVGTAGALNYFATVEIVPLPPAPPAAIAGSSCKNKFATQTDCVHTIVWAPSPTPTVVAYQVSRNNVLIGTVPASVLTFIDHNRCNQTDVYTVTAVDINGLLSTPAVVIIGPAVQTSRCE